MAATPKAGVFYFRGLQSGATYAKSMLNEDVVNTLCRWDSGGGTPATTKGSDFCTFPEDVSLYDCSFVTGIVDTQNLRIMADYSPTNFTINWATHVNSLANRPVLNIGFKRGTRISGMSTA